MLAVKAALREDRSARLLSSADRLSRSDARLGGSKTRDGSARPSLPVRRAWQSYCGNGPLFIDVRAVTYAVGIEASAARLPVARRWQAARS